MLDSLPSTVPRYCEPFYMRVCELIDQAGAEQEQTVNMDKLNNSSVKRSSLTSNTNIHSCTISKRSLLYFFSKCNHDHSKPQ